MTAWRVAPAGCIRRWVAGRPTGYSAGENERTWKAAVAAAFVGDAPLTVMSRIGIEAQFRLDPTQRDRLAPDLDNLIKSTVDALINMIGPRKISGPPQADDERVDLIVAEKAVVQPGAPAGAWIAVWELRS
jgi:Holliday junction resolvase RusA-like endonuclease